METMRSSLTLLLSLLVAALLTGQQTQAQQVSLSSSLTRDPVTGEMVGLSKTEMDANTTAWYQSYVYTEIRRQSDNALLAFGENFGAPESSSASRTIRTSGNAGITYRIDGQHWILPRLNSICTTTRLDRYQFTNIGPPFIGGNYGSTQTFFGHDPGFLTGSCVLGWIYLGQTSQVKQVPSVTITTPRAGSVLSQSVHTALLGADIVLSSNVAPTGGSYSWSFSGPFQITGGSKTSGSVTIRSTDAGTITVNLVYMLNGITHTQQFTINVVIPTLQSFTAQQVADRIVPPFECESFNPSWRYKLGCGVVPGIEFSSTIQAQFFISDPAQSGIKYVQAVSEHRKTMEAGNLKCSTIRSDPMNIESGWQLDTMDPYIVEGFPVRRFSEGNSLTIRTQDYPGQALTFATPLDHVDALEIDDRFEMYVVYFTFDPANPTIQRTLGKLAWNFGGLVVFDEPGVHQIRSTRGIPGPKIGQATSSMVTMRGNVKDNQRVQCPGAPSFTNNRIDASRIFVRQHYKDFLNREPDAAGWNHWTSQISKCVFDFNCIYAERIHIGLAFFYAGEFSQNEPDLANPPGSPGFNAATYNRAFIRYCYKKYLGREPDPAGWDWWTNDLNATGNYGHIIEAFITSPEYRDRPF